MKLSHSKRKYITWHIAPLCEQESIVPHPCARLCLKLLLILDNHNKPTRLLTVNIEQVYFTTCGDGDEFRGSDNSIK